MISPPNIPRFLLHSTKFNLQLRLWLVCAIAIMQIGPALLASLLPLTIVSLAIEPSSINLNSLNITLLDESQPSNQTKPYSGECSVIHDRSDLPNFYEDACTTAIPIACSKLTNYRPGLLVRDRWIWTNLPGCSLAFYVPMQVLRANVPTLQECEEQIFGHLVQQCVQPALWNLGTINVFSPPTPSNPGSAFLWSYPRYLVSPKQLDIATSSA